MRSRLRALSKKLDRRACPTTIGRLLRDQKYGLRSHRKVLHTGKTHVERNRQFEHIAQMRSDFRTSGDPRISVDTKKKELLGQFKNPGRTWCQESEKVNDHDFPSDAQGRAAPYGAVAGNRLQPSNRPLQKRTRRHQVGRAPAKRRLQHAFDQPHVVGHRQPGHRGAAGGCIAGMKGGREVVDQVAVAHHDAPGPRRRARRVLQKCKRVAAHLGRAPLLLGALVHLVGRNPFAADRRRLVQAVPGCGRREHRGRCRVVGNAAQPLQGSLRTAALRHLHGHGDDARVKTAEERRDELESRGVQQERALTSRNPRLQVRRDRPALTVELTPTHAGHFLLTVVQEGVRAVVRLDLRAIAQHLNQRVAEKRARHADPP